MKKNIFLFVATACFVFTSKAQDISDALRYSTIDPSYGTARYNAMSGAFNALGGDLSAFSLNPAGSAVFIKNTATTSFSINDITNKATYFGTRVKSGETDFNLNQAGAVFVFDTSMSASPFTKFTIGINYNAVNNYDNDLFISGTGNTSIANFFLEQAQGIPIDLLQLQSGETISSLYSYLGQTQGVRAQNAFLGYQGYIIDPLDPKDPSNSTYVSNVRGNSFQQNYSYRTGGYNGKYTFNFGTQISNRFHFGVNLNTNFIDYYRTTYLRETNSNQASSVRQIGFENNLSVLGSGFSAQFGTIVNLTDALRLGLSYETPTWYTISEETTQYLESSRQVDGNTSFTVVNPRVLNIFADYDLTTPGNFGAGLAYIFGPSGLISFDYTYKDYSNISFGPSYDPVFSELNSEIDSTLKSSSSIRVGGEYRISQFRLRGGYRYEESPYKNKSILGDLNGFSAGIGYSITNFSFDFSYSRSEQDRQQELYTIGLTDTASINTVLNNFIFTFGFNI